MRLVARGCTSQSAAEILVLSKRTVDFHLANIYHKLRVSNRVQAYSEAIRLGLLPLDSAKEDPSN